MFSIRPLRCINLIQQFAVLLALSTVAVALPACEYGEFDDRAVELSVDSRLLAGEPLSTPRTQQSYVRLDLSDGSVIESVVHGSGDDAYHVDLSVTDASGSYTAGLDRFAANMEEAIAPMEELLGVNLSAIQREEIRLLTKERRSEDAARAIYDLVAEFDLGGQNLETDEQAQALVQEWPWYWGLYYACRTAAPKGTQNAESFCSCRWLNRTQSQSYCKCIFPPDGPAVPIDERKKKCGHLTQPGTATLSQSTGQ